MEADLKNHAIEHELTEQAKAAAGIMDVLREREMDDDAELVDGTVEGETGLFEAIDAALLEIDACDVIAEGCKVVVASLTARQSRAKARRDKVRAAIEQAFVISGINEKIVRPTNTLSLTKRKPDLVIDDESLIPADYYEMVPRLDKKKLREAVDSIHAVPGCHMNNGSVSLTIRRK